MSIQADVPFVVKPLGEYDTLGGGCLQGHLANSRGNDPALEKAIFGMWLAMDGLDDLARNHNADCECGLGFDGHAMHYVLQMFSGSLESVSRGLGKMGEWKECVFPPADEMAKLMDEWYAAQEAGR